MKKTILLLPLLLILATIVHATPAIDTTLNILCPGQSGYAIDWFVVDGKTGYIYMLLSSGVMEIDTTIGNQTNLACDSTTNNLANQKSFEILYDQDETYLYGQRDIYQITYSGIYPLITHKGPNPQATYGGAGLSFSELFPSIDGANRAYGIFDGQPETLGPSHYTGFMAFSYNQFNMTLKSIINCSSTNFWKYSPKFELNYTKGTSFSAVDIVDKVMGAFVDTTNRRIVGFGTRSTDNAGFLWSLPYESSGRVNGKKITAASACTWNGLNGEIVQPMSQTGDSIFQYTETQPIVYIPGSVTQWRTINNTPSNKLSYLPNSKLGFITFQTTNLTHRNIMQLVDFNSNDIQQRGSCWLPDSNANKSTGALAYAVAQNETYIFLKGNANATNSTWALCDYTNPNNPTITSYPITYRWEKIYRPRTGTASTYVYASYNTGGGIPNKIARITGISPTSQATLPGSQLTTLVQLQNIGSTTIENATFQNIAVDPNNGMTHITGYTYNNASTHWTIDYFSTEFQTQRAFDITFGRANTLAYGDITTGGISIDYTNNALMTTGGNTEGTLGMGNNTQKRYTNIYNQNTMTPTGYYNATMGNFLRDIASLQDGYYAQLTLIGQTQACRLQILNATDQTTTGRFTPLSQTINFTKNTLCNGILYDQNSQLLFVDAGRTTKIYHYSLTNHTLYLQNDYNTTYNSIGRIKGSMNYLQSNGLLLIARSGINKIEVIDVTDPTLPTHDSWCDPSTVFDTTTGAYTLTGITSDTDETAIAIGTLSTTPAATSVLSQCNIPGGADQNADTEYYATLGTSLYPYAITYTPIDSLMHIIYLNGIYKAYKYSSTIISTNTTNLTNKGNAQISVIATDTGQPVQSMVSIVNYLTGTSLTGYISNASTSVTFGGIDLNTINLIIISPMDIRYSTQSQTLYLTSNALYTTTITLPLRTQTIIDEVTDNFNYTAPGMNLSINYPRECEDTIKNVWLCNMTTTPCTTDADCTSGKCDKLGGQSYCSAFNWKLCDQAGRPRNQACFLKYTSTGTLKGIANWSLGNFLYVAVILAIIFLVITVRVAMNKKR